MIKVTAKTVGDHTELDVHMEGSAMELGVGVASIVTKLPRELIEKCEPAFHIMRAALVGETEAVRAEIREAEADGKDN